MHQQMLHDGAEPEFAEDDHETLGLYAEYDGLLRGAQIGAGLRIWSQMMQSMGLGRWVRVDRKPDRRHAHGQADGHGG